jgi:nucleoside-diphosphate-sugar epimerase
MASLAGSSSARPEGVGPAFVAGATGFTGREVVRLLCERGIQTVAHVRPDSARLDDWRERFAKFGARVDTTPWEKAAMAEALARLQPAWVFALLGTTRARARRAARMGLDPAAESYEAVDYGLTRLVIRAAARCASLRRFVYLSAVGAGAKSSARSPYYRARIRAEALLKASGLPFTIARPSFIAGPGRDDPRPLERMGAAVVDWLLSAAGFLGARRLRDRYASLTNTALAEALVKVALDPAAENRVIECEELRKRSRS